jgi:hypothetical protein
VGLGNEEEEEEEEEERSFYLLILRECKRCRALINLI